MFAKGLCFFQIQHNQAIGSVVRKCGLRAIGNVTQSQARDVGVTHRFRCGGPTAASTHVVTNTYCHVALILNIGKAGIWVVGCHIHCQTCMLLCKGSNVGD